jgi:hypothetical protein
MAAINLSNFGGMLPAWDPHALPEGQAASAQNGYLFSGSLEGWRFPKLLRTLIDPASKFVYRIPNNVTNNAAIDAADSKWMEFLDINTKVIRTPVVDDQYQRYYFASPSQPPKYNSYDRILHDQTPWLLGVPAPTVAPAVNVVGGGALLQIGNTVSDPPDFFGIQSYNFVQNNSVIWTRIVPAGAVVVNSISFPTLLDPTILGAQVIYPDSIGVQFRAGIYDDGGFQTWGPGQGQSGQIPGQLLAESGVTAFGSSNGATVVCPFDAPPSLDANTVYWIAIANDGQYPSVAPSFTLAKPDIGFYVAHLTFTNGFPQTVVGPPNVVDGGSGGPFMMWADCEGQGVYAARSYVYTRLTTYGEEGPPSPPALVNGWSNGTWVITIPPADPLDQGVQRTINRTRIYRTITSTTGQTTYFLVAEIPVSQTTYADTSDDATIGFNDQLVSLFWFPPPADLQGFVAFINGMTVGWRANELWFSEVFRPHAWPPNYVLTTEFPIVGLGITGQSLVVCTEGTPYVVSGALPDGMSMAKVLLPEPCTHPGSIISTDIAVLYQSPNGLIEVDQTGAAANMTESWVTRDHWQALAPVSGSRAIKLTSLYFAFGTGANSSSQGFTLGLRTLAEQAIGTGYPQAQQGYGIMPLRGKHTLGFMPLTAPNAVDVDNVLSDPWTGAGLLLQGGRIYYYDFSDQAPLIMPYIWRSKIYRQLAKKNYQAVKVFFSVPPNTPAQNPNRNMADPQALDGGQYAILRVFANGQLFTTREVRQSGELLRVYSGGKFDDWQIEIEGRVLINSVQAATSVKELGAI